jgi:tRNA (guanine-N7-)-methyltransferase
LNANALPVDNPARTAAHFARQQNLRGELHTQLAAIIRPGDRLVWEIGCGHGHFLTAYAQAHPTAVCVGIDLSGERIERAIRKRDRAQLGRLHFIRADAQMFIEVLAPGVRVSAVFVLFPDPWPKLRHHKHRLMQAEFLHAVALKAEREARLFFRTDHQPYFESTVELLNSHPDWQLAPPAALWPFEHETVFQRRAPQHYSLIAGLRQP